MPTDAAALLLGPLLAVSPAPLPAAPALPPALVSERPAEERLDCGLVAGILAEAATTGTLPGLGDPGGDDWATRLWLDDQLARRAGDLSATRQLDRQLRGR